MKRRVAIAQAVVDEPEIVLFDEPTTGLGLPTAVTICEMDLKLVAPRPDHLRRD